MNTKTKRHLSWWAEHDKSSTTNSNSDHFNLDETANHKIEVVDDFSDEAGMRSTTDDYQYPQDVIF